MPTRPHKPDITLSSNDRYLSQAIRQYMSRTRGLHEYCERCLKTDRWNSNVVLMVIDAAFTSIGLNYFTSVVPHVVKFENKFVATGQIKTIKDLSTVKLNDVECVWKNRRSWHAAKEIAAYLHLSGLAQHLNNDKATLRHWAKNSSLEHWRDDPVGKITGVGITTFQYLRMMGGVDTAMPDKIVRRVVKEILNSAGSNLPTTDDMDLVNTIHYMAKISGCRSIEICWMTWLIQREGDMIRMDKYDKLLSRI